MPRLDDQSVQNALFKKKEYRAWDDDAFAQLKIKMPLEKQKTDIKTDIRIDIETDIKKINGYQKVKIEDNGYQKSNQISGQNRYQNSYQDTVLDVQKETTSESSLSLKLQVRTLSGYQLNLFKFL